MVTTVSACRLCGAKVLGPVLELGDFRFTGLFPRPGTEVGGGPLTLVCCGECGLVQLAHQYDPSDLYGASYGYRSGLNQSMATHLQSKARGLATQAKLEAGDVALDIGCSDGTLLRAYDEKVTRIGIDPSAGKFRKYHPGGMIFVEDFFSAAAFERQLPGRRAKLVTSIAMFYDLERPLDFAKEVAAVLDDEGLWHLEQSYLPAMLEVNAYDTICHEHTEYYALAQIMWIMERAGLKIVDVYRNDINGGSFALTVAKRASAHPEATAAVAAMMDVERALRLDTRAPFDAFMARVEKERQALRELLERLSREGKRVYGYGASTKGNVVLQYCGIDARLLPKIAEVNADKFGAETPGTHIPIVSEAEARADKPDCFLVLPWHFRKGIEQREQPFKAQGGQLIFPLPTLDIA